MSEKNPTLSNNEIDAIQSAVDNYPKADGILEALTEATSNMYKALMKMKGNNYEKTKRVYYFLVGIEKKLRNNRQLILDFEAKAA